MDASNSFRSIVKWVCGGGTYRLFMSDTSFQLQELYSGTLEEVVNQCGRQYTGVGVRSWVSFSSFLFLFFFPCAGCQTKGAHFTTEQHSWPYFHTVLTILWGVRMMRLLTKLHLHCKCYIDYVVDGLVWNNKVCYLNWCNGANRI